MSQLRYILCCFHKDIITVTELVGWRQLTKHEKEVCVSFFVIFYLFFHTCAKAQYNFWKHYGEAMQVHSIPETSDEAIAFVGDYVESDRLSKATYGGKILKKSISGVLCRYFKYMRGRNNKNLIQVVLGSA